MPRLNEIKDQQQVVTTVGDFADSLQQIAALRMMRLRQSVLSSKRFVAEATLILRELHLEKQKALKKLKKKAGRGNRRTPAPPPPVIRTAIIVVTSDMGLCGSYNLEINNKLNEVLEEYPDSDYYVIGHKGQHYMKSNRNTNIHFYPYNIPENVGINDLKPLIGMFNYYQQIFLLYSKYINTTTREVDFVELSVPEIEEVEAKKEQVEGKFIFEPGIDHLIDAISARIRYALFRQQILDSKLSLYTAQMIAMKTAADNAEELLKDLRQQYNKVRRKLVDKKIQEIQAGRILWDEAI
jgi:F-type H+-transporting ATPase subunit gamma